jgi:hypothetical protein
MSYKIEAECRGLIDELATAETLEEAARLLAEFALSFDSEWILSIREVA